MRLGTSYLNVANIARVEIKQMSIEVQKKWMVEIFPKRSLYKSHTIYFERENQAHEWVETSFGHLDKKNSVFTGYENECDY